MRAVLAQEYRDNLPADEFEGLQLAAQEQRVWREVLQVFRLGDRLPAELSGTLGESAGRAWVRV